MDGCTIKIAKLLSTILYSSLEIYDVYMYVSQIDRYIVSCVRYHFNLIGSFYI